MPSAVRPDGLCRIQAELGEQALCKTCREFPRLTHDYGSFLEYGLELSCPEAARRILCSPATLPPVHPLTGEEEYDSAAMTLLLRTRQQAIALLAGDAPPKVSAGSLLEYGARVQRMLDGSEEAPVPDAQDAYFAEITEFFANLEPLTDRWQPLLCQARLSPLPGEALPLLRYFVGRYWLQAIADDDLLSRIKLSVVAAVLISALPGDFTANAVLFSREIENSAENIDLLLDLLAYSPRFSCRAVARLLL
ncbi:MAG: hypothetical protein LUH51_08205 [Firmicutes bacterium]|nr:hypothetical protein [Bacillota bacterium]